MVFSGELASNLPSTKPLGLPDSMGRSSDHLRSRVDSEYHDGHRSAAYDQFTGDLLRKWERSPEGLQSIPLFKDLEELRRSGLTIRLDQGTELLRLLKPIGELSELNQSVGRDYDKFFWRVPALSEAEVAYFRQEEYVGENLKVVSGPLAAFDYETIAVATDMAARVYAQELLHIEKIARRECTPAMVDSFVRYYQIELLTSLSRSYRDDNVIVMVMGEHNGKEYLLGSIGAVRGKTDWTLDQTIGWDGVAGREMSSIPTNMSVEYEITRDEAEILSKIRERDAIEITRLNRLYENMMPPEIEGKFDLEIIRQLLVTRIHQSIVEYHPDVEVEIFNTKPKLNNILQNRLGLPIHPVGRNTRATEAVKSGVHGLYFDPKKRHVEGRQPREGEEMVQVQLMRVDEAQARGNELYINLLTSS